MMVEEMSLDFVRSSQERARDILVYLAPHFGINNLSDIKININTSSSSYPYTQRNPWAGPRIFNIYLRGEKDLDNTVLAHEIGHCLHWLTGYGGIRTRSAIELEESVANYAELLFYHQEDDFIDHEFDLSYLLSLTTGDLRDSKLLEEEIENFHELLENKLKQEVA